MPSAWTARQLCLQEGKTLADPHCVPIMLLPLLGGWAASPTVYGERNLCGSACFRRKPKQNKMHVQGIHINLSHTEKSQAGDNTVEKNTASQCAFQYRDPVNTQI